MPRIYISGRIAGVEGFRDRFKHYENRLVNWGWEVVNPVDIMPMQHDGPCPPGYAEGDGHSSACHLKADIMALATCDAIVMMKGWEMGRGSPLEHANAVLFGMTVYYSLRDVPFQ